MESRRPSVRRRCRSALLLVVVAAACSDRVTSPVAPPSPPTPAPVVDSLRARAVRWSDPASWPGGRVPAAGDTAVIPAGRVVLLDTTPPPLAGVLVDGALLFDERDLELTARWVMVHGHLRVGTEARPFRQRATITLTGIPSGESVMGMGTKLVGVMGGGTLDLHGAPRTAWLRLGATAHRGATTLTLERAVDWVAGDRIVVASSDYDPAQAEELVVEAVDGATVTIATPLRFDHWGERQTFAGRPLDERAEVGLLSRNVLVRGDPGSLASGFGGQIMAMAGATTRVSGVELFRMGQAGRIGRYPFHWHMAGEVAGSYLRNSSVWRTLQRCVTIHGTHAATVTGNVCYDHAGHGYFMEDGIETRNLIEGNLGLVSRVPDASVMLLASDSRPATFWVTNPDNIVRGNAAAGSRGFGFWYALPEHPTGLSTNAGVWPRRTPLGEFRGNVAHSSTRGGLHVDDGPMADGSTTQVTSYAPRQVPGAESPAVVADFRDFTGFKNPGRAVWLRGRDTRLVGAMLADNGIGATFASSETVLEDAVIVGESANYTKLPNATFPIRGFEYYDGRVGARRVTFVNFVPTGARQAGALGFNRNNSFGLSTGNFGEALVFEQSNRVYVEDPRADRDGDKAAVLLDADGTITGARGMFVAANSPLLLDGRCQARPAWNAHVCPGPYAELRLNADQAQSVAPLDVTRDDGATERLVGVGNKPASVAMSIPANRGYVLRYGPTAPTRPRLRVNKLGATDWVRVALPYPAIPFVAWRDYDKSKPLTAAASLAEVEAGGGERYWHDPATGLLHVKLVPRGGRDYVTVFVDPR